MAVTDALARIYVSAPVDEFLIETLEIFHPAWTQVYYMTNYAGSVTAFLDAASGGAQVTFEPFPFELKLPGSGANGFQDLTISLSNIGRQIIDELERASENATSPITFLYRAYSSADLSQPGFMLPRMTSSQVAVDINAVSAQATMADLVNRSFPNQLYTPTLFPMLMV